MFVPLALLFATPAGATDLDVSAPEVPGSARMLGMGLAYRAIAEGSMSQRMNPAALAVRPQGDDREPWFVGAIFVPRGLVSVASDLRQGALRDAPLPTMGLVGGVNLSRRALGGALLVNWGNRYEAASDRSLSLVEIGLGWGVSLADDQLQVGAMPTLLVARARTADTVGVATLPLLGAGARWDVPDTPLRLGLSGRTPARAAMNHPDVADVHVPWELGAGLALRHGAPTRRNPPADPEPTASGRPRFAQWALDVALLGPLADVATPDAWTGGAPISADVPVSVSLGTGLEAEVVPWWLRVRGGLYTEPARAHASSDRARLHATLGLDVATITWPRRRWRWRWRLSPVVDVSTAGVSGGLGLGTW